MYDGMYLRDQIRMFGEHGGPFTFNVSPRACHKGCLESIGEDSSSFEDKAFTKVHKKTIQIILFKKSSHK